jgi:hypothetical protein
MLSRKKFTSGVCVLAKVVFEAISVRLEKKKTNSPNPAAGLPQWPAILGLKSRSVGDLGENSVINRGSVQTPC